MSKVMYRFFELKHVDPIANAQHGGRGGVKAAQRGDASAASRTAAGGARRRRRQILPGAQFGSNSDPATQLSSPEAVRSRPPLTALNGPEATFWPPPLTDAACPLATFEPPPQTAA
jgi:hypothetical protein